MAKEEVKMRSYQVFHFARKHLGRSLLYAIFGKKNTRAIDYWCEDPRYTSKLDEAFDPIMGVKRLLEALDDHGHTGVVRSTIKYLLSGTSINCQHEQEITEPKPTMAEEILADFAAVADLQRVIDNRADFGTISAYKAAAIAEIERTVAKYREENHEKI